MSKTCGTFHSSLQVCMQQSKESPFKVQKVYFTWMTREQSAPRYFQRTLEDIKDLDRNNFLEVNIYLTQAVPQHNLLGVIAKARHLFPLLHIYSFQPTFVPNVSPPGEGGKAGSGRRPTHLL